MSDTENYKFVFSENNKKLKLYIRKFDSEVKENHAGNKIDLTAYKKLKTIAESTFANESDISEIELPSNLRTIEKEAFKNCRFLKVVQFEGNKKSKLTIQFNAFKDCEKLDSVIFGTDNSLKKLTIEKGAFEGCTSLRAVYLNSSECKISDGAFSGAENIILAVKNGSNVERYARENGIRYVKF
ncbi:MAG: leucine-rich repeat domain-containing protein [Treponema succinifaciens]|uniref:leucine-rich repeat domain-containing protein n=1 Tax=Treponema succinifaciens TaxID=167 RepID=UPI0023536B98|nr:leucine-rich repeat domain-containing protein [Treponema succinifaciens]MCI6913233.1 leucine-rich repeat domain-containing protein [Treponema succinifaciens]MDD6961750.1 leucine-rich repeat domain-containing protein [Treponema succinifaciens]MDY5118173.1 leucine-rich repeat domain-containing protein [Treponema succinifaciens]